jgi:ATP-binding cassette subfamily F protein uup
MEKPVSDVVKKNSQTAAAKKSQKSQRKLGYLQQRELEQLPLKIEALEKQQKKLYEILSDPDLYRRDKEDIAAIREEMLEMENQIKTAYDRWEELEAQSDS